MNADPLPDIRIGVISDTHGLLHPDVFEIFEGVAMIIHAGDVGDDRILDELGAIAPTVAVSGNVDGPPLPGRRPAALRLETPLGRIGVTHGHLEAAPTTSLARMVGFFSDFKPVLIIYGHSHIPKVDRIDGVTLFNPGAAGPPRFGRAPSVGLIEPDGSGGLALRHIDLRYPRR